MDFQDYLCKINGCISAPMPEIIEKYFNKTEKASNTTLSEDTTSNRVTVSNSFADWFVDFATTDRNGARGSWSVLAKDEKHSETGLIDEYTQFSFRSSVTDCKIANPEAAIQAVGLVCPSDADYRDGLITLCASAQTIFYKQPTRLFLHGFYIRGSLVELWTFDRSGLCCSEVMDAKKDPGRFLSLFMQYERMTSQELAMSSIFSLNDKGQYIVLDESTGYNSKLYIDSDPIVTRHMLVGPATVVYRARLSGAGNWSHAVKIKWPGAGDRSENELLEIVREKKVWGAVKLDFYRELETTVHLGSDMSCAHFTEETRRSFENRTLTCIVTSPLRRALHTFQTRLELLEVLRDAIKCHKSLYIDVGLLYSDISPGYMIIVDDPDEEQPRGMLIDLELATPRDPPPERDTSIICGTRPYMAIGYIQDEAKTYRHDLESFFYAFLWMIVGEEVNVPEGSRLHGWEEDSSSWFKLAQQKLSDMEAGNFQHIVDEIPPAFATVKGLAETLRAMLFPVRDGKVWTSTDNTPEGTDKLYDGMIGAFDAAIASDK